MKRLQSVLSLRDIYPIIEEESHTVAQMFKVCVQHPDVYIYLSDNEDALILFLPLDRYKYNTHIYSLPSARGFKLKRFIQEAGIKMFNETMCTTLMNFVEEDNRGLQLFMGAIGSKRVGTIKNSSEAGNTVLYCAYKEDFV